MTQALYVFIGGGIGSLLRYLISLFCTRFFGSGFPFGTMTVNLTGCFLIGFLFSLSTETRYLPPSGRIFLITGFLGGLTTFSSYGLESANLALQGNTYFSFLNVVINNIGGLLLVVGGMITARYLFTGGHS